MRIKFALCTLFALLAFSLQAQDSEKQTLVGRLEDRLSNTSSLADSIEILYNLYDLSPQSESTPIARKLLEVAERTHDDDMAFEMLCQLAFLNVRDDNVLKQLKQKCDSFPESDRRKMVHTYISLRRVANNALYTPDGERIARIRKAIEDGFFHKSTDRYQKIQQLATVCILMGSSTAHRGILNHYVEDLLVLVDDLPDTDLYLKNLVYYFASILYTNMSMNDKAYAVGMKRLKTLDELTEKFHSEGRVYYNFEYHYYHAYRNLLQNYQALTPEQVEDFYEKVEHLAEVNSDVRIGTERGISRAYYCMATGRYEEAKPLLRNIYKSSKDRFVCLRALREMISAASLTNDDAAQSEAAKLYSQMLEEYILEDGQNTYTEMQIMYDLNQLQDQNTMLREQRANVERLNRENAARYTILGLVLLFIALILLFALYSRARKLAASLKASNEALTRESEVLRNAQNSLIQARDQAKRAERHKAEFINNISHEIKTPLEAIVEYSQLIVDCSDSAANKYLRTYGDIVKVNADLFMDIVNDIFNIGELEDGKISVRTRPAPANDMCAMAVASVRPRLREGVDLIFEPKTPDTILVTDSKRVEQVLINLLNNAVKFTEQGSVVLDYTVDRQKNEIVFSVTDTGPGIPPGREEQIFERFYKIDRQSQGVGLGLPICRMIASLLRGTVTVDMTHTRGARFLFTIPLS